MGIFVISTFTGGRETALGEKLVLTLTESIKGKKHQVYYDYYFSSIDLPSYYRRESMTEISEQAKRFQRGGSTFCQCGNVVATSWKNNRVVNDVSTLASPNETTTVNRRNKDGTTMAVPCPVCVALYNKYMGGVDYADQLPCALEVYENIPYSRKFLRFCDFIKNE